MFKTKRLMSAEAPGGGGGTVKPSEPVKSPLEQAIKKVFPEEAAGGASPAPEPVEPPKQPEGEKPEGETNDLSQQAKPAPNEADKAAEEAEAKEAGLSVEQYREAKAAETKRLEAIAAKTGETFEQIYAREEKEGKPTELEPAAPAGEEKKFSQADMEAAIQKRVKNLAEENANLKRQLAEKPAAAAGNGPLDGISDPAKLAEAEATAQSGLEQADDLLAQLRDDPEGVEQVLRKYYGDQADGVDFSPANMRQILRNAKEGFRNTLKAVPQRKAWLEARAKAEPIARATHPWLENPEDPRTVLFQQTIGMMPVLKQNPAWDYWLGHAITGHLNAVAAAKKNGGGSAKAPAGFKLKIKSALPGSTAKPAGAPRKTSLAEAKARGDVDAMAEAIGLD